MTSTVNDPFEAAPAGFGLFPPPPQLAANSVAAIIPRKTRRQVRRRRVAGSVIKAIAGTTPSDPASIHSRAGSSAAVVTALIVNVELPDGPALPGVIDCGENEHFRLGGRFAQESWNV